MKTTLWIVRVVALAIVTLALPVLASAQDWVLRGVVVDASGAAVAGARVRPVRDGRATTTDADGAFVLTGRTPAPREIAVDRERFSPARVTVDPALPTVRVVLAIAGLDERVRVVAPLVDGTSVDTFGAARTIVSSAQVDDLGAVDFASALRRTPGVTIARFNPVGSFGGGDGGAVFIRGMGTSRPGSEIATSIDGAPVYMGVWTHPLLDLLPVAGMDEITVLKGPQPQTFGNAFAAVDIVTRRPRSEGFEGNLRVSGGAFATFAEHVSLAGRRGPWDISASQAFARSDGHREAADGRLAHAFGRVGYRWNANWSASAQVLHADNAASDPGYVGMPYTRTGRYETRGTMTSARVAHAHDRVTGSLQVYANRGAGDWLNQLDLEGDTLTRFALTGARWRESATLWQGGSVSGGLDVDRISGNVTFDRIAPAQDARFDGEALTIVSPHVGIDHTFALSSGWAITPSAGVRVYTHSEFDGDAAPHAAVVARHSSGLSFRASYARGVSYPGQNVVALSALIPALGSTWRDLRAETMEHGEVGATFAPTAGTSIDVAVYQDNVNNRYVFGFPPRVSFPMFTNVGGYAVRGLEVGVRQRLGSAWQVTGGLTTLATTEPRPPYAPWISSAVGVTGTMGRWRLSADVQAQAWMYVLAQSRTIGALNGQMVPAFAVVNVRPSYVWPSRGRHAEVFVAIDNLFDTDYAYRPDYPMPGISAQVGISIGFGAPTP